MYRQGSPYGRSPYGGPPSSAAAGSGINLLGQVLGITGVGFLITAVAAYLFRDVSYGAGLLALVGGFVLLFVMNGVRNSPQIALLWFYAFTFLEGIGLAPVITAYVRTIGPDVVVSAAATTGFGMLVLGGVAFVFSVDWRRFSGIAIGAARRAGARRAGLGVHALGAPGHVLVADARRVHAAHARGFQPHPRGRRRPHARPARRRDLPRRDQHLPRAARAVRLPLAGAKLGERNRDRPRPVPEA